MALMALPVQCRVARMGIYATPRAWEDSSIRFLFFYARKPGAAYLQQMFAGTESVTWKELQTNRGFKYRVLRKRNIKLGSTS